MNTEHLVRIRDRLWGNNVRLEATYMLPENESYRRRLFAALDVIYANAAGRLLLTGRNLPVVIKFPHMSGRTMYDEDGQLITLTTSTFLDAQPGGFENTLVHELCHFALHGMGGSQPKSETAIWDLRTWLEQEAKRRHWTDDQLLDISEPLRRIDTFESRTETVAGLFMRCIFGSTPSSGYYAPQLPHAPWTFHYDGHVRPVSPKTLADLRHVLNAGIRGGYVVSGIPNAKAEVATFNAVVDRAVARHLLSATEAAQQRHKWTYRLENGSYPE